MPHPTPIRGARVALALAAALWFAASTAHAAPADRMRGRYLGVEGLRLDIAEEYDLFLRGEAFHPWRAVAWQVISLGIGSAWYWANADLNKQDWDYPGWEARLDLSAVRFDDNHFTINHVSHPFSGAAYYALARVNGMGVISSAGFSIATSSVWEFILEWRELVSLNDSIFTPGAGIPIGEAIYRLAHYVNSAPEGGGWPQKIAAATVGFPLWIHRWFDGRTVPSGPADELGFSAAYHHRFRLAYLRAAVDDAVTEKSGLDGFDLRMRLYAIPGFGRPGETEMLFSAGDLVDVSAWATWDEDGEGAEWVMLFETVLAGYYTQKLEGPPEAVSGSAALAGIVVGYEQAQRWRPEPRDRWSMVHMPGPDGSIWVYWDGFSARLHLVMRPTFNAIDSVATSDWKLENPDLQLRSVLDRRGYYYGFGLSGRLELELAYAGASLGGMVRYAYVESFDGVDRAQEDVQYDEPLDDEMVVYSAWAQYTVPRWLLSARLGFTRTERQGAIGDLRRERTWHRVEGSVGIEF
ncbi:MAG: DUF3943 domain-containing protein [Myxococcales bacterium]|nr:DUF3943 domain-containing protein [Myxococcales bacterium]